MGQDASAIRHEIEATRSRMADIVESIGERFDIPSRVRADVGPREVMTTGIVAATQECVVGDKTIIAIATSQ